MFATKKVGKWNQDGTLFSLILRHGRGEGERKMERG
jgi:hypothetical protein